MSIRGQSDVSQTEGRWAGTVHTSNTIGLAGDATCRVDSDTSEEQHPGLAAGTLGFAPVALKVLSGLAQSQV